MAQRACGACDERAPSYIVTSPSTPFEVQESKARVSSGGEAAFSCILSLSAPWCGRVGLGESHIRAQSMAEVGGSCGQNVFTFTVTQKAPQQNSRNLQSWSHLLPASTSLLYLGLQHHFLSSHISGYREDLLKVESNFRTTTPNLRKYMMTKKINYEFNHTSV